MKNTLIVIGTILLLAVVPVSSAAGDSTSLAAAGVSYGAFSACVSVGFPTLVNPNSGECNFSGSGSDSGLDGVSFGKGQAVAVAAHVLGEEICVIVLGPGLVDQCSTSMPWVVGLP